LLFGATCFALQILDRGAQAVARGAETLSQQEKGTWQICSQK
jgi:hypothetical protein